MVALILLLILPARTSSFAMDWLLVLIIVALSFTIAIIIMSVVVLCILVIWFLRWIPFRRRVLLRRRALPVSLRRRLRSSTIVRTLGCLVVTLIVGHSSNILAG